MGTFLCNPPPPIPWIPLSTITSSFQSSQLLSDSIKVPVGKTGIQSFKGAKEIRRGKSVEEPSSSQLATLGRGFSAKIELTWPRHYWKKRGVRSDAAVREPHALARPRPPAASRSPSAQPRPRRGEGTCSPPPRRWQQHSPPALASPPLQPGPACQGLPHPLASLPGARETVKGRVFSSLRYPRSLPRFTKLMTMSASLRKALSCALVSGDAPPPGPAARRLLLLTGGAAPGGGCRGWVELTRSRGPCCRLSSSDAQSSSSSEARALYRSSMKRGADFSRPGGGSPRGCCCGRAAGCGCWRPCRGRGRCGSPSTERISFCISRFSCVLSRR